YNNKIHGFTSSNPNNPGGNILSPEGILTVIGSQGAASAPATTYKVYNNYLWDFTSNGTSAQMMGIECNVQSIAGVSNSVTVQNNMISDLKAPVLNHATNGIIG